jgi:hypothetical protein
MLLCSCLISSQANHRMRHTVAQTNQLMHARSICTISNMYIYLACLLMISVQACIMRALAVSRECCFSLGDRVQLLATEWMLSEHHTFAIFMVSQLPSLEYRCPNEPMCCRQIALGAIMSQGPRYLDVDHIPVTTGRDEHCVASVKLLPMQSIAAQTICAQLVNGLAA